MAIVHRPRYGRASSIVYQGSGLDDPITQLTDMLEPVASFTKLVTAAGSWSLARTEVGRPFFCAALEGSFQIAAEHAEPITVRAGDFVLLPMARRFETFSLDRNPGDPRQSIPFDCGDGVFRLGDQDGDPTMRKLIGYGEFRAEHSDTLAALLPTVIHIENDARLTTLVELIDNEARTRRPAKTGVMTRLLGVLMIEALRSSAASSVSAGLLRGLADERVGASLRALHADPAASWTSEKLAGEAGLSRSAFFDRFSRTVGMSPMEYLLHWRMHLARQLLPDKPAAQVAHAVGYGSTSAFSTAFTRHVGTTPTSFIRELRVS